MVTFLTGAVTVRFTSLDLFGITGGYEESYWEYEERRPTRCNN